MLTAWLTDVPPLVACSTAEGPDRRSVVAEIAIHVAAVAERSGFEIQRLPGSFGTWGLRSAGGDRGFVDLEHVDGAWQIRLLGPGVEFSGSPEKVLTQRGIFERVFHGGSGTLHEERA